MSLPGPDAPLGPHEVKQAADRIGAIVRRVEVIGGQPWAPGTSRVFLACEFMQHTGSVKARGAANLAAYHLEHSSMPRAGIAIAHPGNAGLACAWAARATGTAATVFVPATTPPTRIGNLRAHGAAVETAGSSFEDAHRACMDFAAASGAIASHPADQPLLAAGAGTLALELCDAVPDLDTVLVPVGHGALLAGTLAALAHTQIGVVAVEPERACALHAALTAGGPVAIEPDSHAAHALGAPRISATAFELARTASVRSALVSDRAIRDARQQLWDQRRIVVETAAATALAALISGAYRPAAGERVAVVLTGANTDPSTLFY